MTTPPADVLGTLRDIIRRNVAAGFAPPERIVAEAAEMAADGTDFEPDDLREAAERLTSEALAAHLFEQEGWPDDTDCDRLDAAFAALEADGIVARQHFSCCTTCGHADIGEEIAAAEAAGRGVRGYAFYHVQNTGTAVGGGGLHLHYGAVEDGDRAAERIAADILDALFAYGLTPGWGGSADECVFVPLVWQRRRPAVIMAR